MKQKDIKKVNVEYRKSLQKLRLLPSYQQEVDSNSNIKCAEMVKSSLGKQLQQNFAGSFRQIGVLRVLIESYEESSCEFPDQESGSNKKRKTKKDEWEERWDN